MSGIFTIVAWLNDTSARIYVRKWSFLALFGVVFAGSLFTLARFDLLPETNPGASGALATTTISHSKKVVAASKKTAAVEVPVTIEIKKIGLAVSIANPTTTDIGALDALLLKGAVRYPTSAKLGEKGNMVVFGHSSYLPVVRNQAFKAFNGIQKLAAEDVITVYSATTAYTYRVKSVTKESAENDSIPLSVSGRMLTLATCDSFGEKSDRFVVVAEFVESHSISST